MAYVVGKRVTRDSKEFDSFAFGLQLPQQSGKLFTQNYIKEPGRIAGLYLVQLQHLLLPDRQILTLFH